MMYKWTPKMVKKTIVTPSLSILTVIQVHPLNLFTDPVVENSTDTIHALRDAMKLPMTREEFDAFLYLAELCSVIQSLINARNGSRIVLHTAYTGAGKTSM